MAKGKKNEVAAPGQFLPTMDKVPELLAQVEASMKALKSKYGGDSDDTPANGQLDGFGDLTSVEDISTLVQAHSAVVNREKAYKGSAKTLGVSVSKYPFKINGATAAKWEKFIMRRVGEVTYADQLAKLKATKAKLTKYVSEEQQFASDMKDIADILKVD